MFHVFPCIALMCGLFPLTRGLSCTERQQAEALSLDCSHRHLTSLPDTPSEKVTKLDVTYNDLSALPGDSLSSRFPALQQLDVSHNAITAIGNMTFQELSELQDLDLSYNQLHVMHNGTLSGLSSSLRTLSLSHNRLQQLDDTAFRGLATLTSLSLDNNHLTSLTASTFSGLVSLRYVDLSHNALSSILNNTFADLVSLRSLRLDHNQMERLEPAALAGLKQLVDINLNDNRLEFVHWSLPAGVFADLESVERFELKFNSRSNTGGYPEGVFGDLVSVRYLALDSFLDMEFGPEFARLSHIETLDVADSCKVNTLRNSSLLAFKNSSLQNLQLTSCHSLVSIETCAFCDLPHLKNLYLTHNDVMHTGEAFRAMYGLQGQSLDEINFRGVSSWLPELFIIDSNMTKYINNVCVRTFIMSHAQIQRVTHDAMFHTADSQLSRCIQHVDLSENYLNGDRGVFINIFVHTKTLISLQLQEQHVYSLKGSACVLSVAPECGNRGSRTSPSWSDTFYLPFPPSLQYLNLSAMFTFFNSMPHRVDAPSALGLKTLDLSFGFTSHCMTTFTGFQHLETFDFSGNYCNNISDNIFDHLVSLRHLSLSSAHLNPADIRTRAHRLLQHVDRLETLDLSWNWLVEIQGRSLPAQSRLQRLLLSHNSLESLPVDVGLHPNLTDLDLSFNSVPSLTSAERDSLDELASRHLFRLNLRGNPMLCACSNLNFLRWMWDTNVILDGDGSSGRRYTCTLDTGEITDTEQVMAEWDSLWRRCLGQRLLALALVCFFFQMLALVTVYLVSRSWTHIVYAWNVIRHLRLPRRLDFRKDAFVVYAEADTEFVFDKLGPCLERFGVRLLLRHMEDLPGSIIAENIVKNIEDSWKVLLVVTQAFSQCEWSCSFSVQQAQRSISDTLPDRVLVLFLQDLYTLPPMASLEVLLRNYPERNVFHARRDLPERHAAWEALASAILRERDLLQGLRCTSRKWVPLNRQRTNRGF